MAGREAAESLGEAVEALDPAPTGVGVFEIEDGSGLWEVGAYFTARPDEIGLDLLAAVHGARPFAVSRLDDRDWVAQVRRELTPVRAGRFVVHGGHDRDAIGVHEIGLEIEAAMAFGTGHHATTLGCLRALSALAKKGMRPRRVADLGSGTGVLAMAAAALWHVPAVATDIDQTAVATALANARANRVAPHVAVARGAGCRVARLGESAPYDLLFANILARPLRAMAPAIAAHVTPGGVAILSGLLTPQSRGVAAVYRGFGFGVADRLEINGWTTLTLRRLGG